MSALKWQKCPIFGFATKTCQTCLTCPLFSVSITPALSYYVVALCGYFFSHKICGEEGSPILWLLIVPTYYAHLPQQTLGPVWMFFWMECGKLEVCGASTCPALFCTNDGRRLHRIQCRSSHQVDGLDGLEKFGFLTVQLWDGLTLL
jgi:hypothetical protein